MIKKGFWRSTGKNLFWINIIEEKVFWLGMNQQTEEKKIGQNWCHVGNGIIKENKLHLEWSDVPLGEDSLSGKIVIEIISDTEMKVIKDSGNFGLSQWNWESEKMSFESAKN